MNFKNFTDLQLVDLATNSTDVDELFKLAMIDSYCVRKAVAENVQCPPTALDILVTNISTVVAEAAYLNPNLSPESYKRLANETREDLLLDVAENCDNSNTKLAESLLNSEFVDVRETIINFFPFSPECLNRQALKERRTVTLSAIASQENVSEETLEYLSTLKSEKVNISIAYNPKTPAHILIPYLGDNSTNVTNAALESRNLPSEHIHKFVQQVVNETTFSSLLRSPHLTIEDYNVLLDRAQIYIKTRNKEMFYARAADSKNTPPQILERLSNEAGTVDVATRIVSNMNCSPEVITKIHEKYVIKNFHATTAQNIAQNPNTPISVLEKLYFIETNLTDKEPITQGLLKNPALPLDLLHKIHEENNPLFAVFVAEQMWMKDPKFVGWSKDWVEAHFGVTLPNSNYIDDWNDDNDQRIN